METDGADTHTAAHFGASATRQESAGAYEDTVWNHLAGTISAPFPAGDCGKVAVKVIDDRGNKLPVVKDLKEAEG